jgi:hypothetical protein
MIWFKGVSESKPPGNRIYLQPAGVMDLLIKNAKQEITDELDLVLLPN